MMQLQTEGLADLIVAHLRLLDEATRIAEEASRGAAPETVDVGQRLMAAVGDAKMYSEGPLHPRPLLHIDVEDYLRRIMSDHSSGASKALRGFYSPPRGRSE